MSETCAIVQAKQMVFVTLCRFTRKGLKVSLIQKAMEITRDANNIHVREIILKKIKNILHPFGDHVHSHGITCTAGKSHI